MQYLFYNGRSRSSDDEIKHTREVETNKVSYFFLALKITIAPNTTMRYRNRYGLTLVELLIILAIFFFFVFLLPWTFKAFVFWGTLGVIFGAIAVLVAIRKNSKALLIASIPLIACLIPFFFMFPTVFPMQLAKLREAHYKNTPLVEILSDISSQKKEDPYWRFYIEDRELARLKVNVDLPDKCRLGEALKIITDKSNCKMLWYWHKGCGNEPSPICASICFYRNEDEEGNYLFGKVMVNRDNVYGLEKE